MDNISGLCSYTQKIPERSRLCAGCDTKETGCIRAPAARTHLTFSKSVMVAMGVSKLGRMDLIFIDAKVKIASHTTVRCFWLESYRLSCVRSVKSSLSSSKAMFLLTERARPLTFRKQDTSVSFTRPLATRHHRSEPIWLQTTRRNAAAGLSSSWCRWTETAVDRCLASFQAKRHRWRSWWVA